ncbi:hypothetical protein SLA2020_472280 [Shorea laevis]
MDSVWVALKRSINCQPEPSDVVNPNRIRGRKPFLCGSCCSNARDNIHVDKRQTEKKPTTCLTKVPSDISCSLDAGSHGFFCHKCGGKFSDSEAVESHHLSKHAVIELAKGNSTRKIVELICQRSEINSKNSCQGIERVLKVQNMQRTIHEFEGYREMVKIKAGNISEENSRNTVDGNEVLMFYGAAVACSLGMNRTSNLCTLDQCGVCKILRHGFSLKKESNGVMGVFTSSISRSAFEHIEVDKEKQTLKRALIVCRVIAGRVHRPLEISQEIQDPSCFDSITVKLGPDSDIEELYSLNSRALLPCFVVIFKVQIL